VDGRHAARPLFDGTPVSWNQILWRYNQETFNVAPIEMVLQ
jgi:hypothetical protein